MAKYIRPLSIRDLDQCVAVESAAFPPNEAASRDKIEYRLSVSPHICFGLFLANPQTADSTGPITSVGDVVFQAERSPADGDILVAHAIATLSDTRTVKDSDMVMPANWKTATEADPVYGHRPDGKTIALHSLAVHPGYQNSGFGKTLMRFYLEQMNRSGVVDRVAILTYDRLIPYYEGLGFKNLGKSESRYAGVEWNALVYEFAASKTQ